MAKRIVKTRIFAGRTLIPNESIIPIQIQDTATIIKVVFPGRSGKLEIKIKKTSRRNGLRNNCS